MVEEIIVAEEDFARRTLAELAQDAVLADQGGQ
jgi:hypothetical protein